MSELQMPAVTSCFQSLCILSQTLLSSSWECKLSRPHIQMRRDPKIAKLCMLYHGDELVFQLEFNSLLCYYWLIVEVQFSHFLRGDRCFIDSNVITFWHKLFFLNFGISISPEFQYQFKKSFSVGIISQRRAQDKWFTKQVSSRIYIIFLAMYKYYNSNKMMWVLDPFHILPSGC